MVARLSRGPTPVLSLLLILDASQHRSLLRLMRYVSECAAAGMPVGHVFSIVWSETKVLLLLLLSLPVALGNGADAPLIFVDCCSAE